jgi:LPXTG-site transpeptidase (sortase) family protein
MKLNWVIKLGGSLLVVLGLFIGLAAAVGAISDARQAASPFNQVDNTIGSSQGFVPIIAPQAGSIGQVVAPALPSPTPGPNGETQSLQRGGIQDTQTTSTAPVHPPVIGQALTAVEATPATATPVPIWIPDRIIIPAIKLDAPVVPATFRDIWFQAKLYRQWLAPNSFDVGRLMTSAPLGVVGNTVLIGHHNDYGEVFGHLVDLHVGDLIMVYSGDKMFVYAIALRMILPERDQPLEVRLKNAQWIASSQDERLTLITCWPFNSNTHRLVIVATPINWDPSNNER